MRKPAFCICENKDAHQLRGNRKADQCLCFRYTDSTIPLVSKFEIFKPLAIFCGCTARFVSDLIGNPEDRFTHDAAHIRCMCSILGMTIGHSNTSNNNMTSTSQTDGPSTLRNASPNFTESICQRTV